ncbi:MAG: adenylate kinase [Elusimicrobia bacterium]|nr:adenylate kinase [Elusimicrobiota bacterium]
MTSPLNLVLLGVPGAGKGTQAPALCAKYNLRHLSTGDIFRAEIGGKTPLGLKVKAILDAGQLVSDDVVLEVVQSAIAMETRGLLFDGFPRTVAQARGLDKFFAANGKKLDAVILVDLDEAVVVDRLGARRSCPACKQVYNVRTNPPVKEGVCDKCGQKLVWRDDDKPETIKTRLEAYRKDTAPLVQYYEQAGRLLRVDGSMPPAKVSESIAALLQKI